ncbi:MAG: hypothetical protein JO211_07330 [Acidobacteriaceae bacterium]|nr:hypothetical protein [Acidobacteriaceae bacterium]
MKDLDTLSSSDKKMAPVAATGYSNDVKPVSPTNTSADLSLEAKWRELLADEQAAELSDTDLTKLWETRNSTAEFAETVRDLESRGRVLDFSSEPEEDADLADEELWQHFQDVVSGEAGRQRAVRNVTEAAQDRADYWRRQDGPVPRDVEDLI